MKVIKAGALCALLAMLAACGGSNSSASVGTSPSSSTSSSSSTGTSTGAPLVALTSATYTAAPASSAIVAIYRTGTTAGAASVGYTTVNGTAMAGTDYTATSGAVTWSDGEAAVKTVAVPVTSRAAGKQFAVALTSVQGQASFGSPTAATVAVADSSGVSASGTMIPSATQIVHSTHTVWTLASGVVYQGGTAVAHSANISLLLYFGGTLYQQNKSCLWGSWSGSAWVASSNPAPTLTPACSSAPASVTPPTTPTTPTGGFGIQVKGDQFVSAKDGSPLQLVGTNISGLETGSTSRWAYFI